MSAIAYFLEDEGIATTGISLVRENTVSFRPPRFLWVSFPLGRPLGLPCNPAFQHRVIEHALDLLNRRCAAVLEDFPDDVEGSAAQARAATPTFVCPVSFTSTDGEETYTWTAKLRAEIGDLSAWYDAAVTRRGRTSVGVVGHAPQELGALLGEILDNNTTPPPNLALVLEDLKTYYLEAMSAQPGASAENCARWLWRETSLGEAIVLLQRELLTSPDPYWHERAQNLVPRKVLAEMSEDSGNIDE